MALSYKFCAPGVEGWVAAHIPGCADGFPSGGWSLGVWDGPLIGGIVYHNHYPQHGVVEMSAAGTDPRWLSRRVLYVAHDFAFNGLGCQLIVLRVSARNGRMQSIARRYGYTGHTIPRLRGRDEAETIFTLADDDWRNSKWGSHGQT